MITKKIKTGIKIFKEKGAKALLLLLFQLLNNWAFRILEIPLYPVAIWKIKKFRYRNLEELFNFSWNLFFGIIRPMQIKEEILELLKIIKEKKPKTILEIGTANGGTLFLFCQMALGDANIISIDLPLDLYGYPYWKIILYQAFKKEKQKLFILKRNSHNKKTLEEVKKILNCKQVDFLFIDGDHSYEGVKKDFEMYSPLVKKDGIIAFHDVVLHYVKNNCEVGKYWDEIKNQYQFKEIIRWEDLNKEGVGLIFVK